MAFEAALLDLWDTLIWAPWSSIMDRVSARVGIDEGRLRAAYDETRPARNMGAFPDTRGNFEAILAVAGADPSDGLVDELVEMQRIFQAKEVRLFDDSIGVLRELRARGVRTAIVSNCDHETQPVIDRLGLTREVDELILSCELGVIKPDPAIFHAALDALDVRTEGAIFVDDQRSYCDGAAALGIDTRLILRPDADPAEGVGRETGGHVVIQDLSPLLEPQDSPAP